MRKVVNGKLYDTETAEEVASDSYSNPRDFNHWSETLCMTPKGAYFLCGKGGARTKYGRQVEQNSWTGGQAIIPLSKEEALQWLERCGVTDTILKHFANYVEEA